jgi:tetratricopeptide (TPR) repeat protein
MTKTNNMKDYHEKPPMPESYQAGLILNEYDKDQLLEIINKYHLNSHHWNLLGTAFRNLKEDSLSAENAYKEAIEKHPEYDEPYGNLLSLYIAQEKFDLFEHVFRQGMKNASKKSFIIYQDGRLAFMKGNFNQSLMAAMSILIDEEMKNEGAYVLGIHSLLSMLDIEKSAEKNFNEALKMWKMDISVFPDSESLIQLSIHFEGNP